MIDKSELTVVTSPKLFTDNNYERIDEEGLLSQKIFGPLKSWHCSCGTLRTKTLHAGKTCKKCGVKCAPSDLRNSTFAKIVLPYPVYKNTHKSKKLLRKIVRNSKYIIDPLQTDLSITTENYLTIDAKSGKTYIIDTYNPGTCIPIKITGIYTFYLALLAGYKLFANCDCEEAIKDIFDYELLVVPPDTRHVFFKRENGIKQLINNELNLYYQSILRLCEYDWSQVRDPKDYEESYLQIIKFHVNHHEPVHSEELLLCDRIICKYQYYTNLIYKTVISALSGKDGYIRKDFLGRTVDFAARAHIIIDPSLKAYEIKVPKKVFSRLWFVEYLHYINNFKNVKMEKLKPHVIMSDNKIDDKYLKYEDEFIEYFTDETKVDFRKRLVLINRQPTLWRYGIPCVKVIGVSKGDVTCLSPLLLEQTNADFDGDTMAIYRIHDARATRELEKNAYMLNNVTYDHNGDFIQRIRLENLYSAYVLLNSVPDKSSPISCLKLQNLPTDFETTLKFNTPVLINGKTYAYGICLFNKWSGFKEIKIKGFLKAGDISREIYKDSNSNEEYHERLNELNKKLLWYVSTHPQETLTLSLNEIAELNMGKHKETLKKLPYNPHIGQHIYEAITHRVYDDIPDHHQLRKLTRIKIQKTQLSRMIGAIGYIADDQNIVNSKPLTGSIFSGLDRDTFFLTAIGTRKGIVDKARATPDSGYLERSMVINLSPVEIDLDDCGTSIVFPIKILNATHVRSLFRRWYHDFDKAIDILYTPTDINAEIGKTYYFRSPITCCNPNFKICKKCFGKYYIPTPYVGVLAGQYIAERMTQLSMRTFHTSGSCTLPTNKEIVNLIYKYLEDINPNKMLYSTKNDTGTTITLATVLNTEQIELFRKIPGFVDFHIENDRTFLMYLNKDRVQNKDVTQVIKAVNKLLRRQNPKDLIEVTDVYQEYIENVLDVGQIYSSFVEIVLCNMYLTKSKEILRYALQKNPNAQSHYKLSIRKLHTVISKLLGLLYEPNEISIGSYTSGSNLQQQGKTILEKIWNNVII